MNSLNDGKMQLAEFAQLVADLQHASQQANAMTLPLGPSPVLPPPWINGGHPLPGGGWDAGIRLHEATPTPSLPPLNNDNGFHIHGQFSPDPTPRPMPAPTPAPTPESTRPDVGTVHRRTVVGTVHTCAGVRPTFAFSPAPPSSGARRALTATISAKCEVVPNSGSAQTPTRGGPLDRTIWDTSGSSELATGRRLSLEERAAMEEEWVARQRAQAQGAVSQGLCGGLGHVTPVARCTFPTPHSSTASRAAAEQRGPPVTF